MRTMMSVLKALADENRVRIVVALRERELCVCQIIELLGLAQSTVSKHMAILKQAQLVESRKVGRWIYYRGYDLDAPDGVTSTVEAVTKSLCQEKQIQEDAEALKRILEIDTEELCRRQTEN